eukprot:6179734-Karenia_brevis.AAC.1
MLPQPVSSMFDGELSRPAHVSALAHAQHVLDHPIGPPGPAAPTAWFLDLDFLIWRAIPKH